MSSIQLLRYNLILQIKCISCFTQLAFKIKSKYTLKDIKYTLGIIYRDLGISKTPKASDLCNYFEVSEVKIYDSVLKKQNKGYLILGIK